MCSLEFYKSNSTGACQGGMPAVVGCVPGPLFATASAQKQQRRRQQGQQVSPAGRECRAAAGWGAAAIPRADWPSSPPHTNSSASGSRVGQSLVRAVWKC